MIKANELKQVYIVISQTGTVLSRILKLITGAEYNHASISLADDLSVMYSFGRRNPYNPFWGGFVTESAHFGTFKRFAKTKVTVLAVDVSPKKYEAMSSFLDNMLTTRSDYGYNYLGLCLAAFNICFKRQNRYYCSEFVREVLLKHHIKGSKQLLGIVHPMNFLNMPYARTVYCGKLKDYSNR